MSDSSSPEPRSEAKVRHLIRELIRELAPNPEGLRLENPHLVNDLRYHSLALLELAFTLEDEFNLEPIDQEIARQIGTAKDVEDYVVGKVLAAQAPATP